VVELGALVYCRIYEFLKDQGSIIAGLLALLAGVVAYYGSRKAADLQVKAAEKQTDILREQNTYLVRENRRKLARDSLVAIRLVIGALERIKADTKDLKRRFQEPPHSMPGSPGTATPRDLELISAPAMQLLWQNLGLCGQEVIDKFLLVDKIIHEVKRADNWNVIHITSKLTEINTIIDFLDEELSTEAQKCYSVLKD
jgi:hypothetical protein